MNRCRKCKNELVAGARFCNICGAPQNPENAQPAPPLPLENPARTIQPSSKHTYSPQVSGDNPNQPGKTDTSDQSQDKPVETIPPAQSLAQPTPPRRSPGLIRSIESSIPARPTASRPPTTVKQTPAAPTHLPPSPPASTQSPQRPGPAPAANVQAQNKHALSDPPTQHLKSDSKQGRKP